MGLTSCKSTSRPCCDRKIPSLEINITEDDERDTNFSNIEEFGETLQKCSPNDFRRRSCLMSFGTTQFNSNTKILLLQSLEKHEKYQGDFVITNSDKEQMNRPSVSSLNQSNLSCIQVRDRKNTSFLEFPHGILKKQTSSQLSVFTPTTKKKVSFQSDILFSPELNLF